VNFVDVCIVIFGIYIFNSSIFLRHQTMDEVQKYNSFNTNTPSSESHWYPLDRRLGGLQSHFGRGGEEKNFLFPPGIEP
jgi:hypothetical protein